MLYCAASAEQVSLEQACSEISHLHGIEIKKQSLDERFHQGALDFILAILHKVIGSQQVIELEPKFLDMFNHVRIMDSTKFNIPSALKDIFKGFNGRGISSAGVSIQYEFDVKSGKVLNLDLFSAGKSDSKYADETCETIQERDLIIRDLGYYSSENLKSIQSSGAFFISRLNAKANVYRQDSQGKLIIVDFKKMYHNMVRKKLTEIEIPVYIGNHKKLPVRLIVQLMPNEVYVKRTTKLEKYNKANGHQTSNEIKERIRFNLFVTNIEIDVLTLQQVCTLYKIRWQVELVFKCWKSQMGIAKIQKMKYARFATVLYAKLLLTIMNNEIISCIRHKFYIMDNKLLSMIKCLKTMRQHGHMVRKLMVSPSTLIFCVNYYESLLSKNHWQDKRKKRTGFIEIMKLFCSNTDNYTIFKKKQRATEQKHNPLFINNLSSL